MDIIQCTICRKPFQTLGRKICHNCLEEMDKDFVKVRDYLDEVPDASIDKVSEDTKVSKRVILYLVKDGRLIIKGAGDGKGGLLTCEVCKKQIFEGKICDTCKKNLVSIIDKKIGDKPARAGNPGSGNIKTAAKIIN